MNAGKLIIFTALGVLLSFYITEVDLFADIRSLDASWNFMMSYFYWKNFQYGSDVIFNFGPLGYLYSLIYFPDTYISKIVLKLIIDIFLIFGLLISFKISTFKRLLCFSILILFLNIVRDVERFLPVFGFIYNEIHRQPGDRKARSVSFVMLTLMAIASMAKSSAFLLSVPVVLIVTLYNIHRRDYRPYYLIAFPCLNIGLLIATGQAPEHWVPFLLSYLDITRAYQADMGLPAPLSYQIAWGIGAALVLSSVPLARRQGWYLGVLLLGALMIAYKASFIRNGPLIDAAALSLAFLAAAQLWTTESRFFGWGHRAALAGVSIAATFFASQALVPIWPDGTAFGRIAQDMVTNVRFFIDSAYRDGVQARLQQEFTEHLAAMRADVPFKALTGPVDAFPIDLGTAYALGLPLAPRPAFQAYFATSRLMTERNAAFLASDRAATSILYRPSFAIDGRYPALEDPLSRRALRRYYDLADRQGDWMLLTRRAVPRSENESCASHETKLNADIAVPETAADQALWAGVRVQSTGFGHLAGLGLVPPRMGMRVTLASGYTASFRFLQEAGSVGFFLSPMLAIPEADAAFLAGTIRAEDRVTAVRIEAPEGGFLPWFRPEVSVDFCRLSWQ